MKPELLTLKKNIENNMDILKKKHPISPLIAESISILIELNADESDINAWASNQKTFIRNIQKEIKQIEESNKYKVC